MILFIIFLLKIVVICQPQTVDDEQTLSKLVWMHDFHTGVEPTSIVGKSQDAVVRPGSGLHLPKSTSFLNCQFMWPPNFDGLTLGVWFRASSDTCV